MKLRHTSWSLALAAALLGAARCQYQPAGAYHYEYFNAFDIYADTVAPQAVILYIAPNHRLTSGIANVKQPLQVAVSSRPPRTLSWTEDRDTRGERAIRLTALPDSGFCGRLRIEPGRQYHLSLMGDLRDPKLEDPKAKSFGIYQQVSLDSLGTASAELRARALSSCTDPPSRK